MTIEELQTLLTDQAAFKRAFKRADVIELLKGNFKPGRIPSVFQVTFPNGSQLRLKFYSTIKRIMNSKGQEMPGKESYLSYIEVTVGLVGGLKSYMYTTDLNQIVWGTAKGEATVKNVGAIANLVAFAKELGIELGPDNWCHTYTENH